MAGIGRFVPNSKDVPQVRRARSTRQRSIAALVLIAALAPGVSAQPADGPRPVWTAHGTGFVQELELADLDGDGARDIVLGGRGVGAITSASLGAGWYAWVNKWPRG